MFLFLAAPAIAVLAPAIAVLAIAAPATASPATASPAISAQTLPVGSSVPDQALESILSANGSEPTPVETFDPLGRAALMAQELPRSWSGSYQSFDATTSLPADLQLTSLEPVGQMVVLRGALTIGGVSAPVQGNLNAKSDQLNLLLVGAQRIDALEAGGYFQGLEGLTLSTWVAPRFTSLGGRLQLDPSAAAGVGRAQRTVRGLW